MRLGDRVFRKNYEKEEIEKGTIDSILGASLNDTIVYIVKWDNGTRTKCLDVDLNLLIEDTPDPDSVRISRSEFRDLVMKINHANNYPNANMEELELIQTIGLNVCVKLEREIFGDKTKND